MQVPARRHQGPAAKARGWGGGFGKTTFAGRSQRIATTCASRYPPEFIIGVWTSPPLRVRAEVDVSAHNRMSHKFHVGQLVEFRPKKGSPISAARGTYEIPRRMPERDGELQYRIKSAVEEHERIALESELGAF